MKIVLSTLFSLLILASSAQLKLPKLFGDHMVLQRDMPVRFWGWASPDEPIQISIDGFSTSTRADKSGNWECLFPAHAAGGPFEVRVKGQTELTYTDVYFGEVWIAGGQSNMEWKLSWKVNNWEAEVKDSNYPQIRFFEVPNEMSVRPKNDISSGDWKVAGPGTSPEFSAVAWFFAKANHLEKGVPVGVIDSNWGGTPAEAWMSTTRCMGIPGYELSAAEMLDPAIDWEALRLENEQQSELKWKLIDDKTTFMKIGAQLPEYDDSGWSTVSLPSTEAINDFVWFRKSIDLKSPKNVRFYLGEITQICHVFFNDTLVSQETWQDTTGIVTVPKEALRDGKNVLSLRVVNSWDNNVRVGRKGQMWIENKGKRTSLEGDWKYSNTLEPPMPKVEFFHWRPGMIFNGMIAPIAGYSIKGVIWYQGESNADKPQQYKVLFEEMIEDWQMSWKQGRFPFLYVQLANFMERQKEPSQSNWAELREAQTQTLELPKTGMATIIDIGDAQDIHPRNKQDVGARLWLAARKVAYGENIMYSGPMYKSHSINGNTVTVEFDFSGSGFKPVGEVKGFALAGADGRFYWATARIEGSKVVATSQNVPDPKFIRYAWGDNPDCNLYNKEGLPAVPFRTDK